MGTKRLVLVGEAMTQHEVEAKSHYNKNLIKPSTFRSTTFKDIIFFLGFDFDSHGSNLSHSERASRNLAHFADINTNTIVDSVISYYHLRGGGESLDPICRDSSPPPLKKNDIIIKKRIYIMIRA